MTAPPMGYSYEDEDGVTLAVVPYPHPQAADVAEVTVHGSDACRVLREHLADVAAGLWTGAGLPAPVILERPAIVPGAVTEGGITAGREGRAICVGLPPGPSTRRLDPAGARRLAVALAVYADEVDAEPDPAEVEELATVIRTELYPPSEALGLRPAEQDRTAARAALRWMKQREADHG